MKPEKPEPIKVTPAAPKPAKDSTLGEKEPEPAPELGVDWGSNIDPGPGPDPRAIDRGGRPPGRDMAV